MNHRLWGFSVCNWILHKLLIRSTMISVKKKGGGGKEEEKVGVGRFFFPLKPEFSLYAPILKHF